MTTREFECPQCGKTATVETDISDNNLFTLIGCADGHDSRDMVEL